MNFLCSIVLHTSQLHDGPVTFVGTHTVTRHVITAGLDGLLLVCKENPLGLEIVRSVTMAHPSGTAKSINTLISLMSC